RSPRWRSSSALECQGAVKIGRILLWGPRRPGMFALLRERSRPPVACRQRSPTLPTSESTMTSIRHAPVRAVLVLTLCGCYAGAATGAAIPQEPASLARSCRSPDWLEQERGRACLDREGPGALAQAVRGARHHRERLHLR